MQIALAVMALLAAEAPDAPISPPETRPIPALVTVAFVASGTQASANVGYIQHHVVSWVERWGTPVDDSQAGQARVGLRGVELLVACSRNAATCSGETLPYRAVLSGEVAVNSGTWSVALVVTGLDGQRWTNVTVTAPSLAELLDRLITAAQSIADVTARMVGRPINFDPPTRPYSTVPFVIGGVAVASGIVFLILAGIEDGKLSNPNQSLPDAVSARNAANTYAIVGYSLTAAGVVGAVVGLLLYAPGARPAAPPPLTLSVDPTHGMVLLGGRLP